MFIKKIGGSPNPFAEMGEIRGRRQDGAKANKTEAFADVLRQTDAGNRDRIEISGRTENSGGLFDSVKCQIKNLFTQDTDAGRLAALKDSISNGNYGFSPAEMARIMLMDE